MSMFADFAKALDDLEEAFSKKAAVYDTPTKTWDDVFCGYGMTAGLYEIEKKIARVRRAMASEDANKDWAMDDNLKDIAAYALFLKCLLGYSGDNDEGVKV